FVGLKDGGFSFFKIPKTVGNKIHFTNFRLRRGNADPGYVSVSDIVEDHDKSMLVAVTETGVHRFNPRDKSFRQILKDSISNRPQRLTVDSKHRLWISTWGDGLYVFDKSTKQLAHHKAGPADHQLKVNQIEGVYEDLEGNFWIPTDNGLSFLNRSADPFGESAFTTYRHNEFEPTSLLSNPIKAFYRDKINRLWIGSYYGGINIYDEKAMKFNAVRAKAWDAGSISSNNISAFEEDENGNLWIGTDGGGLNYLEGGVANIRKNTFKKINIQLNGQPVEKIKCLEFDQAGHLWIGTWGSGMFRLNTATLEYKHFGAGSNSSESLLVDQVMQIKTDSLNNLWIGTFSAGITYFDQKKNRFTHFPNLSVDTVASYRYTIKSIHIDEVGRVWVATEIMGLRLFNPGKQSFDVIESGVLKKDVTILTIHEDKEGIVWLGTNDLGLISYNPVTKETALYDNKSGLANNMIYSIEQDKRTGNFWLGTNKGLSEFDVVKKTARNYTRTDGLQGNQYNPESSLQTADGTLLFGGIDGLDVFLPADIQMREWLPEIVFTNFSLDNVAANVHDKGSPLKENIILAEAIDLNYDQNSFSVEFAMLEHSASRNNQYSYILEGLNSNWQFIGTERKATFTNLYPGTYTLKVRASNSDGLWTTSEKKLVVNIHPAWWQTTLFKAGVITLLTLATVAVVRLRMQYLIRQKRKLQKKVLERTHELKLKNRELTARIEEIRIQNGELHKQKVQITEKNNEIQAQNEELTAQNDQIILQRENLIKAEQKLKEANEQLEEQVVQRTKKLEETIMQLDKTVTELDRFVYSASHDLSAPLKSVLGLVQIARLEKETDRVGEYYNHIEFSIQKLDRVIKSMVEFSRNYHLDVQSTDLVFRDLVNEVLRELAFWPEARKISFKNTVAPESVLRTDTQRMKVVLHNLISNSVKYADLTKPDSFIHIDLHQNGSGNTIIISDNGMGIEKERQSRIFEMYYRATDRSQGSGLGLFIVKEIIVKLGGTIEVKSTLGSGSSFIINIPDKMGA
ncbi:MAG TPA: two-component regulator propeller domain-containing protein, partial [Chryseolinea sp.]